MFYIRQNKLFIFFSLFTLLIMYSALIQSRYLDGNLESYKTGGLARGYLIVNAPPIAENGAEVGVSARARVSTASAWVREILVFSSYSLHKPLAKFKFSRKALPFFRTRMKLRHSTILHVIAVLSNGRYLYQRKLIKVTTGGCGGGGGSVRNRVSSRSLVLNSAPRAVQIKPRRVNKSGYTKLKTNKTWKRSTLIPNTSRLMIGDNQALPLRAMQANIRIDGFRARVLLEMEYYNPHHRSYEGRLQLRLPTGASPYYLAFGQSIYRSDHEHVKPAQFLGRRISNPDFSPKGIIRQRKNRWSNVKVARLVPKQKAAFAYQQTVARRIDPALAEWAGAGVFNAKVFPLAPRKLHKVVVGYDMNLSRLGSRLNYEIDLPDSLPATSVHISVANKNSVQYKVSPQVMPRTIGTRKHFYFPDNYKRKIKLSLNETTPHALLSRPNASSSYFSYQWKPRVPKDSAQPVSDKAIFMLDTSLSSNPDKFNIYLKLLKSILEKNQDQIKKFAVLTFDINTHWWRNKFVINNKANRQLIIRRANKLVLEGATDLDKALAEALSPTWSTGPSKNWPIFLLSDGAATWGEASVNIMASRFTKGSLNPLYAYVTGLGGTEKLVLNKFANLSGGAVFSVVGEDQLTQVAKAHRSVPWKIEKASVDNGKDIIIAGRPAYYYPGQELTLAGRGRLQQGSKIRLRLSQNGKQYQSEIKVDGLVYSPLVKRIYGQIAVNQLEQFDFLSEKISQAYSMHYRVAAKTTSLLMLESNRDYLRFNIKPADNELVVKHKKVNAEITLILKNEAGKITSRKARMVAFLENLEKTPGLKFEFNQSLRTIVEAMPDRVYLFNRIKLNTPGIIKEQVNARYLQTLKRKNFSYDTINRVAIRRARSVNKASALKVLSNLVENRPGDSVLARDVAYSAIKMGMGGEAYYLFKRTIASRPYEPQGYRALANLLVEAGNYNLAMLYFEIGLNGKWNSRFGQYKNILAYDYVHMLNKVRHNKIKVQMKDFALRRLVKLKRQYRISNQDLVVSITWNTDRTDIDLHVQESSGDVVYYANPRSRSGGHLSRDVRQGYGPEMYRIKYATPGLYRIRAKYYSSNRNRATTRTKVYATIYKNWGRKNESVTKKTISLEYGKQMHPIVNVWMSNIGNLKKVPPSVLKPAIDMMH